MNDGGRLGVEYVTSGHLPTWTIQGSPGSGCGSFSRSFGGALSSSPLPSFTPVRTLSTV